MVAGASLPAPGPVSAQPGFTVESTSVTPSPVAPGAAAMVTTTIHNTGSAAVTLVDMEIWDAGGARVHQQVAAGQAFQAGERRTFQWTWTVPPSQPPGTYRVTIGVFSNDWSALYSWVNQAASASVQSGGGGGAGPPSFTVDTTTVTPSPVVRGTSATIATTLVNTGGAAGGVLIDMEVWNAGGAKVHQQVATGQTFQPGERKTLQWTWAVPAGQATGAYQIAIGVFSQGWATLYVWRSGAAGFTVQSTPTFTLTVASSGTGSGTITSDPTGIACGSACSGTYASGTALTLTATPGAGSTFAGWSGGCTGTAPCTVTLNGDRNVTAGFTTQAALTVVKAGPGSGTVRSATAGIECGADCAETYQSGTVVTLTADADPGAVFAGWSGAGCTGTAACTVTLQAAATVTATFALPGTDNPIEAENRLPGSAGWRIGPVADDSTKQIKGYPSATSVARGEALTFHVTVNPAQSFTIDVYRLGWYGGLGGRLMLQAGPLPGFPQAECPPNPWTGLIACAWSPSYTLTVPGTWTSGVYLAVLTSAGGWQNYVPFVVRDDRPAAILYQMSVTTYQAYNNYPNDGSGKSLYGFNSGGGTTMSGDRRAVEVSFDRPYQDNGAGQLFHWEIHMIRWLERSGYDVTYSTNLDTHAQGARLRNHRVFLSVGHDEYWSKAMFDAVEGARDAGVSLGFFGANIAYWQVRFAPSAAGVPNRVMICYKDGGLDPVTDATATVRFRQPPVNRPEQALVGIQYTSYVDWFALAPLVVQNTGHALYAGTGLQDADALPGLVGYEMDRTMSEYPLPPHTVRTILSRSPFVDVDGKADYAESAVYQAPSTAWVFAAGTLSWTWGLDDYDTGRADARLGKLTDNVFRLLLGLP
jgi:hypothetical protein